MPSEKEAILLEAIKQSNGLFFGQLVPIYKTKKILQDTLKQLVAQGKIEVRSDGKFYYIK